jgi:hypothetical protein
MFRRADAVVLRLFVRFWPRSVIETPLFSEENKEMVWCSQQATWLFGIAALLCLPYLACCAHALWTLYTRDPRGMRRSWRIARFAILLLSLW